MAPKNVLHGASRAAPHRLEMGDRPAPPHDGESLTTVLDGVEKVREVAGGISRADFGHEIRLSDFNMNHF